MRNAEKCANDNMADKSLARGKNIGISLSW